jgi:hypothetical protein
MTHKCCSPECAEIFGREQTKKQVAKKEREETKVRKEKITPHKHFLDMTQRVVNKYVLTKFADLPCVACGKSPYDGVRHASHFKSRGSNSYLRFNLWNIWPCCYSCNFKKSGNIHEMRKGLIEIIGIEKLEFLDNAPRVRIYEKEYLERMRRIFAKKTRRLSSARLKS